MVRRAKLAGTARAMRNAAMRLTLRQLQIFAAVATAGSTTAAAADIALSQSATSAALNELESLLGRKLFSRAGGRLLLNEHGRSMLPAARWVLDAAHGIESQFGRGGLPTALNLRIAASTTIGNYLLPRVIAGYSRSGEGARFALDIGNTEQVVRAVVAFDVDLGLVEGPVIEPDLRVIPWMNDELVVVASPRHGLALAGRSGKVALESLREATWLLREPGSGTREVVEGALLPHVHRLRTGAVFASSEAIKQAVAEGMGLTCLSRHAIADLVEMGRLVILPTRLPRIERTLYLIHHEHRYLSPALGRFIDFCVSSYRPRK